MCDVSKTYDFFFFSITTHDPPITAANMAINAPISMFVIFSYCMSGEGEIRTRGGLAVSPVFKTGALDQLCDLSQSQIPNCHQHIEIFCIISSDLLEQDLPL
jgi:hypothetical protein